MSISTNPQTTTNSELPDPKPKPPAPLEDQTSSPRPPHPPLQYPDSPRLREHFSSIDFDEPISADEMFRQTTQSPVVKPQKAIDSDGVQKRAEQVPPEIHAGQGGGVRRTPLRRVRFVRSCKNAGNDAAVRDMDDDRKKYKGLAEKVEMSGEPDREGDVSSAEWEPETDGDSGDGFGEENEYEEASPTGRSRDQRRRNGLGDHSQRPKRIRAERARKTGAYRKPHS